MIRASSSVLPTPSSSSSKHTTRQDDCAPSTQHPGLGVPTFGWRHRRAAVRRVLDVEIAAIADNSDDAAGFDGPCALAKREKPNQLGRSSLFSLAFMFSFLFSLMSGCESFLLFLPVRFAFYAAAAGHARSVPPLSPPPSQCLALPNQHPFIRLTIYPTTLPACLPFLLHPTLYCTFFFSGCCSSWPLTRKSRRTKAMQMTKKARNARTR